MIMTLHLILNCYIASLGFLNVGIIYSWPATALPSIRKGRVTSEIMMDSNLNKKDLL